MPVALGRAVTGLERLPTPESDLDLDNSSNMNRRAAQGCILAEEFVQWQVSACTTWIAFPQHVFYTKAGSGSDHEKLTKLTADGVESLIHFCQELQHEASILETCVERYLPAIGAEAKFEVSLSSPRAQRIACPDRPDCKPMRLLDDLEVFQMSAELTIDEGNRYHDDGRLHAGLKALEDRCKGLATGVRKLGYGEWVAKPKRHVYLPAELRRMPEFSPDSLMATLPQGSFGVRAIPESVILNHLGGAEWMGLVSEANKERVPGGIYYLLEPDDKHPFEALPRRPLTHGARVVGIIDPLDGWDEGSWVNVPLFMCVGEEGGERLFAYFGNYQQQRYSDALDHDHIVDYMPAVFMDKWAAALTEPRRPTRITAQLTQELKLPVAPFSLFVRDAREASYSGRKKSTQHAGADDEVMMQASRAYLQAVKSEEKEAEAVVETLTPEAVRACYLAVRAPHCSP